MSGYNGNMPMRRQALEEHLGELFQGVNPLRQIKSNLYEKPGDASQERTEKDIPFYNDHLQFQTMVMMMNLDSDIAIGAEYQI
jgi:hypothetical protein